MDRYVTTIELNDKQAMDHFKALEKKVDDLLKKKASLKPGEFFDEAELRKAEKALDQFKTQMNGVDKVLVNISEVSVANLRISLKKLKDESKHMIPDSDEWKRHQEAIYEIDNRIKELTSSTRKENKETEELVNNVENLSKVLKNMDSASMDNLIQARKYLEAEVSKADHGSWQYNIQFENLEKVKARIQEIEDEHKKVNTLIDKYNQEIKESERQLVDVKEQTNFINRTLGNLSSASIRDIEYAIKMLNAQMKGMNRGEAFEEMEKKLKMLRTELEKTRYESKASQSVLNRTADFFNKIQGAYIAALSAITGLSMTVRKSVKAFADMEEEMANVRKYTGLTDEEVRVLNEDLKKIDTRTSRDELNKLAGSAGRLGITSKEAILEFVDAADKIKVALGDDLGEGAVDQIGKLAMAFGEDERMGLRGAMLATGSAVNELAQNSAAKAGYLVDFTARVAGFGKQLGLTQAQIMGFGAVMDENLLRDEMAATAFGNMLTKMQTDTEKFARIAGMEVKEFTKLLNEDANQAILRLGDSLRSQDPQTMIKMLDDMGLDGSRAVGVLSTLADKIDDVRSRQELATKAYKDGTSVGKEFDVMNNTVKARLEKCKKAFEETAVELGEKLLPVVRYATTSFSLLVKQLNICTDYVIEHKKEVTIAGAALVAYTTYVYAAEIATKAYTIATKAAKMATQAFNFAVKKNPVGLLVAALAAALVYLYEYRDRIAGAEGSMNNLKKAGEKLVDGIASIVKAISGLIGWFEKMYNEIWLVRKIIQLFVINVAVGFGTISNIIKTWVDQFAAVSTMLEGLLTLDFEKIGLGYKKFFISLKDMAKEQFSIIKNAGIGIFSNPPDPNEQNAVEGGAAVGRGIGKNSEEENIKDQWKNKRLAREKQKKDELQFKQQQEYQTEQERKEEEKRRKEEERARRKAEADRLRQEREELKEIKERDKQLKAEADNRLAEEELNYAAGLRSYRDYLAERTRIQLESIAERKKLFSEESAEFQRLDAQEKLISLHGDEKSRELSLKVMDREHQLKMTKINADFQTVGSETYQNEVALNEALFREDVRYLEEKKKMYKAGSLEYMELEWELQDRNEEHRLDKERRFQEMLANMKISYLGMSNEEQLKAAMNGLEELKKAWGDKLSEGDWRRIKIGIEAQYSSTQTPSEMARKTGSDMLKVASDKAKEKTGDKGDTPLIGTVRQYMATMEQLKAIYASDEQNHAAYLAAKQQATAEFCNQLASEFQAAYNAINQIMSAASSYYSAQSDYEIALMNKRYDKEAEKAGNNQKKLKKIEEKRAKEEAAIKSKYNAKAVKIQIAQALASTAMSAINAYASALQVGGMAGLILAPIAAAAAVAAGMIQVAAIKKQAQVQEAGYYSGGYTGGTQYRKEAGVVHQGEFVASHQAVNNPNVRPMLDFIDKAQRNNTVGTLTADDISRQLGGGAAVVTPVVNVQTDNEDLRQSIDENREVNSRLLKIIEEKGIKLEFPLDSFHKNYTHFLILDER